MKQVSFIFATGESWLDRLVTTATRATWSHVALRFDEDNLLVEALAGRGLLLEAGDKYAGWERSQTVSCSIDDGAYAAMLSQVHQWKQMTIAYGYETCLAIGVKDTQLYPLGMSGKEGEIDTLSVKTRAERFGFTCRKLRHSPSRISQMVPSGGSVRLRELGRPWLSMASLWTSPP